MTWYEIYVAHQLQCDKIRPEFNYVGSETDKNVGVVKKNMK